MVEESKSLPKNI